MAEKKEANVGDLVEVLVAIRNANSAQNEAIDAFINKVGTEVMAPSVAKYTAKDYDKLPWQKGFSQKRPTWEKCVMCPMENKDLAVIRDDLVNLCTKDQSGNEATIRAPFVAFEWGYWIYKSDFGEYLYRRPMTSPAKK